MPLIRIAVVISTIFIMSSAALAADERPNFLQQDVLDLSAILAPPPANDSATTKAELAEIHRVQAKATDAERKQAVADIAEDIFVFKSALGDKFTADKLPIAAAFFAHVESAEGEFVGPAKAFWNRPRPPFVDSTIEPCEKAKNTGAYPSGHSTSGHLLAIVLAKMVPEKRDTIFKRVEEYAHNRIVCGVHYPSDVEAGRISGAVIAALLMQNASFQSEFAPARAEVRKLLDLPAR